MYISGVHDYGAHEEHTEATKPFIEQNRRQSIEREIELLIAEEFDLLEEYANRYISDLASTRAERFLEHVLKGDDDAAMQLLGDRNNGDRYRIMGCDTGKPWPVLIHGKLFETGGMELRRKIVEANIDILQTERMADLEAVIDGLKQQVLKLQNIIDEKAR